MPEVPVPQTPPARSGHRTLRALQAALLAAGLGLVAGLALVHALAAPRRMSLEALEGQNPWTRSLRGPVRVQGAPSGRIVDVARTDRLQGQVLSRWDVDLFLLGSGSRALPVAWRSTVESPNMSRETGPSREWVGVLEPLPPLALPSLERRAREEGRRLVPLLLVPWRVPGWPAGLAAALGAALAGLASLRDLRSARRLAREGRPGGAETPVLRPPMRPEASLALLTVGLGTWGSLSLLQPPVAWVGVGLFAAAALAGLAASRRAFYRLDDRGLVVETGACRFELPFAQVRWLYREDGCDGVRRLGVLRLSSGERRELELPATSEAERFWATLEQRCPDAALGHRPWMDRAWLERSEEGWGEVVRRTRNGEGLPGA